MKEFHTVDLGKSKIYRSIASLRVFISKNLHNVDVEMGYVEPGHSMKGRKVWLFTDEDVNKMYERYQGKPTIRLWCYTCTLKKEPSTSAKTGSKYEEKQSEVDEVYEELQKKHKGTYSPEQLRAWSHMIRLKTHDSLEKPPDKPFFKGRKRHTSTSKELHSPTGKAPESKRVAMSTAVSPGRKVNIRSELIDQRQKWHKLLDSGVVTQGEYDNLKEKILSDIKDL